MPAPLTSLPIATETLAVCRRSSKAQETSLTQLAAFARRGCLLMGVSIASTGVKSARIKPKRGSKGEKCSYCTAPYSVCVLHNDGQLMSMSNELGKVSGSKTVHLALVAPGTPRSIASE